jgi:hypothetical protein
VPVVLLPNRKANKRGVSGEVGENADTHTPTVIVYVAQIADVIRDIRDGRVGRVKPVMVSVELGHVVALTIAHEVGHVLGLPHATSGIMKAEPEVGELLQLRASRLSFKPVENYANATGNDGPRQSGRPGYPLSDIYHSSGALITPHD